MAEEIELKLSVSESFHNALINNRVIKALAKTPVQVSALENAYYDTPRLQLNQHRIALRVRRQGDRYIQTLKTRGQSQGGLHQRQEWEWDLEGPTLDASLLPHSSLPDEIALNELQPLFHTNFERVLWILQAADGTGIELVLDRGWVTGNEPTKKDAISEIELELLSGDPQQLFLLALKLSQDIPLRITRVSKAERGYRLSDPLRARQSLQMSPEQQADITPLTLFRYLLELVQNTIESYLFLCDETLLTKLPGALDQLQALCQTASLGVPDEIQQSLNLSRTELRRLLGPWLLQQRFGLVTATTAEQAERLLSIRQLLDSQPFCHNLLQLSYHAYLLTGNGKK